MRTPGRNRAGYVVFLAYQVTTIVIISVNLIPIIMEKLSTIISHSPSFLICTNHSSAHLLSSSSTSKSPSLIWFSALQLVDSITLGHVMVETVLHGVDIEAKKKQVRANHFVLQSNDGVAMMNPDRSPAKLYPKVISPFSPTGAPPDGRSEAGSSCRRQSAKGENGSGR